MGVASIVHHVSCKWSDHSLKIIIAFLVWLLISGIFLLVEIFNVDMRTLSFEKICCSLGDLCWFHSGPIVGISITAATSCFWKTLSESVSDKSWLSPLIIVLSNFCVVVTTGNVSLSHLLRARTRVYSWGCALEESLTGTHNWLLLQVSLSHHKGSLAWIIMVDSLHVFRIHRN